MPPGGRPGDQAAQELGQQARPGRGGRRMVQFGYSTPLGVPLTPDDAAGALRELQAAGRFASVTRDVLIDVVRVAVRDQALLVASGRWDPEHADPARFVAGDIAALRGMTTQPLLLPAIQFRIHDHGSKVTTVADVNRLLKDPPPISLLIDIYRATPHFIPLPATAALLATHPPDAQSVAAIRLPTAQTLVVFGADLPLDTSAYPWPAVAVDQLPRDAIPREMRTRGGAVTGVVLLADPDGKLRDECIWLLGANPDPELPFPDSLDHRRTALRGWRSAAQLRPLVETCAAAVAGAIWTPPPAGDGRPLPVNPLDARWATLRADDRFRRYERD